MLGAIDHLLFLMLAALGPVWTATFGYRRLLRAAPYRLEHVRLSVYRAAIAIQWGMTAAVAALWLATGRPWGWLGLVPRLKAGLWGVLLGTLLMAGIVIRQRLQVMRDDEALAEVRSRMSHVEPMLPRTAREMRLFLALSVTAGICEEVLYRGYMIQYLAHFTNVYVAAAIAAVIFGFGHLYQGARGIVLTTLVGAFLGAVYIISGSLFPGILLHALMDAHSGHLAHVALRREAELEAEREREAAEWRAAMAAEEPGSEYEELPGPEPAPAPEGAPDSTHGAGAAHEPPSDSAADAGGPPDSASGAHPSA